MRHWTFTMPRHVFSPRPRHCSHPIYLVLSLSSSLSLCVFLYSSFSLSLSLSLSMCVVNFSTLGRPCVYGRNRQSWSLCSSTDDSCRCVTVVKCAKWKLNTIFFHECNSTQQNKWYPVKLTLNCRRSLFAAAAAAADKHQYRRQRWRYSDNDSVNSNSNRI